VAALLNAANGDDKLLLFIAIGICTGARRQAIVDLTWDRVDLVGLRIDFRQPHPRARRRKGRAVVPIPVKLAEFLSLFRPASGSGLVIGVTGVAIWHRFRKAVIAAGLGPDVTPHILRHTAATEMVRSVPILLASRMLGHSSTRITESFYAHTRSDDLRPAAEALGSLLVPMHRTPTED